MNQPGHPLRPKKSGNTIAIKDRLWRELFKGLACRPVASRAAEGGGGGEEEEEEGEGFQGTSSGSISLRPASSSGAALSRYAGKCAGPWVASRGTSGDRCRSVGRSGVGGGRGGNRRHVDGDESWFVCFFVLLEVGFRSRLRFSVR